MSFARRSRSLALALALWTSAVGCVSAPASSPACARAERGTVCAASHGHDPLVLEERSTPGGLSPARHGGERAALIVAAVFLFPIVVLVDLLTLPFTAPCHRHFYCTTFVVEHCCR